MGNEIKEEELGLVKANFTQIMGFGIYFALATETLLICTPDWASLVKDLFRNLSQDLFRKNRIMRKHF